MLKKVLPSGHEEVDSIRVMPSVIIVSSDGISEVRVLVIGFGVKKDHGLTRRL